MAPPVPFRTRLRSLARKLLRIPTPFVPAKTAAERISALPGSVYVAIGDSLSAGTGDPYHPFPSPHADSPQGGFRGFTDVLAAHLSEKSPGLRYANLAIQGRRIDDILGRQVDEVLKFKVAPGVVTITAGGNNMMRPRADIEALGREYEEGVRRLRDAGWEVVLIAIHDPGPMPLIGKGRGLVARMNAEIAAIAERTDCVFVDLYNDLPALRDPRAFAADRIHYNDLGHYMVAAYIGEKIGLPLAHSALSMRWDAPRALVTSNASWAFRTAVPALGRMATRRTTGDNWPAKRPDLEVFARPTRPAHGPDTAVSAGRPGPVADPTASAAAAARFRTVRAFGGSVADAVRKARFSGGSVADAVRETRKGIERPTTAMATEADKAVKRFRAR